MLRTCQPPNVGLPDLRAFWRRFAACIVADGCWSIVLEFISGSQSTFLTGRSETEMIKPLMYCIRTFRP